MRFPSRAPKYTIVSARVNILLQSLQVCTIVLPILTTLALLAFGWRASVVMGHWPVPLDDDPQRLARTDTLSALLFTAMPLILFLGLLGMVAYPFVTWALYQRDFFSGRWVLITSIIYVIALVFLISDPGNLWSWYFD